MGMEAHKLWDFFHCRRACLIWHRNASKMNFADVNVNAVPPGSKSGVIFVLKRHPVINEFSTFIVCIRLRMHVLQLHEQLSIFPLGLGRLLLGSIFYVIFLMSLRHFSFSHILQNGMSAWLPPVKKDEKKSTTRRNVSVNVFASVNFPIELAILAHRGYS